MKIAEFTLAGAMAVAAAALSAGCFDNKEAPRQAPEARSAEALSKCDRAALERLLLRGRVTEAELSAPGFFAGLPALKELDLAETGIAAVPAAVADGSLGALEHLYLGENPRLAELPPSLFSKNPNLEYLNLDRSGVTNLPAALGDASRLRWLRLNGTGVQSLPDSTAKLKDLRRIYAQGCKLSAVPPQLEGMEKLEDIVLDGNKEIAEFPGWIAALPSIRNISLGGTKIEKLPDDLGGLAKLSTLTLTGCPLPMEERHRIRKALPSVSIQF